METINEIWKDIDGYDGNYQISNFGRGKSFKNYGKVKVVSQTTQKLYTTVECCVVTWDIMTCRL